MVTIKDFSNGATLQGYSIRGASDETGIPFTTIWEAVRVGQLPSTTIGARVRFIACGDLRAWLDSRAK